MNKIVIAVGIVGSGKSLCLDILADHAKTFTHDSIGPSVTHTLKRCEAKKSFMTLIDVPGQLDSDEKKEESNQLELTNALREGELQTWLYIVSPCNGRITADDINAYHRLVQCYNVEPQSILGVINRDPSTNLLNINEGKEYVQDLKDLFREHKIQVADWCFIPDLDLTIKLDDDKYYYSSDDVSFVKYDLQRKIGQLQELQYKLVRERQTRESLTRRENELKRRMEEDAKLQLRLETERKQTLLLQEETIHLQTEEAQRHLQIQTLELARIQAAADAKLVTQQAEVARLKALADAQIRPVRCEEARGNPCERYKHNYTIGFIKKYGVPVWNCKNDGNKHHAPHVKGW